MSRVLPVVLAGLVMLVVGGWFLLKPKQPLATASAGSSQTGARLVVEGSSAESVQVAAWSGQMRMALPEHISLSMIEEVRQKNGRRVMVFTDGSELELSDYLVSQLPSEVRLRINYQRESK